MDNFAFAVGVGVGAGIGLVAVVAGERPPKGVRHLPVYHPPEERADGVQGPCCRDSAGYG